MAASDRNIPSPTAVRRASWTGFLGTAVEAYDFSVFTFLIVYTSPLFFPSENPASGILSSLLVVGSGILIRPIGGLFFGRLGDRHGRRYALTVTIVGMGVATGLLGLVPTVDSVGFIAVVLLIVLRLAQGFFAGGELAGSATFVTEHTSGSNHGRLSAMTPMGFIVGMATAPGIVSITALVLSPEAMATWGWRVPLLLSVPITVLTLLLRTRLHESPEFERLAEHNAVRRSPVRTVVRRYPGRILKALALTGVVLGTGYVLAAFIPIFLQREAGLTPGSAAGIAAVANILGLGISFGVGVLSDRIGRRNTMLGVLTVVGVSAWPVMYMMTRVDGNLLAIGAGYLLLAGFAGAAAVPAYAFLTSSFPASVRYTGAALAHGLGSAVGGGFSPYLAAQSTALTGHPLAPAGLIMAYSLSGIVVLITMPNKGIAADDLDKATEAESLPVEQSAPSGPQREEPT